jgi:hypothetical protein
MEGIMKATIFVVVLLLFCLGCNSQQNEQLSQQQKDQIKNEVKVTLDSLFAEAERLDAHGTLQYYSSELVTVGDSSLLDYQMSQKKWIDFVNSATSVKLTTVSIGCMVLTKNVAIFTWVGKGDVLLKSGDKTTIDPLSYTDVFKKVGSQWKVIYEHAAGIPVIQKASKK